jgi:hypothetical protein
MDYLRVVFSVVVIAAPCVLVIVMLYGAFFSREDPRFEGDKVIYRT